MPAASLPPNCDNQKCWLLGAQTLKKHWATPNVDQGGGCYYHVHFVAVPSLNWGLAKLNRVSKVTQLGITGSCRSASTAHRCSIHRVAYRCMPGAEGSVTCNNPTQRWTVTQGSPFLSSPTSLPFFPWATWQRFIVDLTPLYKWAHGVLDRREGIAPRHRADKPPGSRRGPTSGNRMPFITQRGVNTDETTGGRQKTS